MVLEDSSSEQKWGDPIQRSALPIELQQDVDSIRADFKRFDITRYPQPLPILGPLFGFNESRVRGMVAAEWSWARRTLKRPLNSDEEDALAGATCKQMRTMSYAGPLGAAAGLYRAYTTRSSWRLPFWSMNKDFNPAVVKLPSGRLIAEGETAKLMWRVLRNSLYGANGVIFMMCFFVSFSASSVSVAIARDPRLKEFAQALAQQVQQARTQRVSQQPGSPSPRRDPTGQGQRSVGELWRTHRTDIENRKGDADDASPSGGQGMDDTYISYGSDRQGAPTQEGQLPRAGTTSTQYSRGTQPGTGKAPSHTAQQPDSESDFIDDWDDASPTAPNARAQRDKSSPTTGGAWERLRRQAASRSDGRPPKSQSPVARGENYSFSSADEDQQLARSEAQQEFDARVERERHGGDFNDKRRNRNW